MSRQYSIAEAREKLSHVIQEAEQGAKVELTRRGKPVAILLSLDEYERLSRKRGSFWESYQEFRRKYSDLDAETADAFADVRDPSPGRDLLVMLKYLLDTNTISEPARPSPNRRLLERLERNAEAIAIAAPV